MSPSRSLPFTRGLPLDDRVQKRAVRTAKGELALAQARLELVERAIVEGQAFGGPECMVGVPPAAPGALRRAPVVPPSMQQRLLQWRLEMREA